MAGGVYEVGSKDIIINTYVVVTKNLRGMGCNNRPFVEVLFVLDKL
jgi:hypothetical protein